MEREVSTMTVKKDYYDTLGINREADDATIKKAYRKLAKKYHPDTNAGDTQAEQKFKEVTEAYNVLSDGEKRKLYDQFGHAAFDGSTANAGAYGGGYQEFHFDNGNMDDIFGDIFGDIFRNSSSAGYEYRSYGGAGSHTDGFGTGGFSRKGADLRAEVSVGFEEAVFGCDKIISLQNMEKGDGSVQSLQVHIPAGIENGKSIRLRGKGMPGVNGGPGGDLLLKVKVAGKPGYERRGQDIYTTSFVPFTTAVLGGEVRVPTLYGEVICKVKEGTQSGTKIRLKGKGVVSMKNSEIYGDQYVTVQIEVPRNLSQEARQKLQDFEQTYRHGSQKRHAAG